MPEKTTAYIGLGSNLGDREDFINKALDLLKQTDRIQLNQTSDAFETAPLGDKTQPQFLNAVAEITTSLNPEDLFKRLTDIETSLGRERGEKWAPRTIDLDLLLFGDQLINTPTLTVPHSQMHLRSFVLTGLCQINPQLTHPVIKLPVTELAARIANSNFTLNPDVPQLISIAGIIGVGKTTLTKKLSDILNCKHLLEAYDSNPFMPDVYAGKKELALDSQIYFLTSRIVQLNPDTLTPGRIVIADYVFEKELIYARQLLDSQQLSLYEKIYTPVSATIAAPVLVIYLQDSAQSCLQRIHNRNRPYEQKIQLQFMEQLTTDYDQLFSNWEASPLIPISISEFDCNNDQDVADLANQIKAYVAV